MSAGAKSTMSRDMEELTQGKEDISKKVQGHKANLSNPNTSDESKAHSQEVVDALGDTAHYGDEAKPHSKSAADNLEGSRVM